VEPLANVYLDELMLYNQEEPSIALANPSSDDDASQTRMPPARPQTRHTIKQQDYRARLDEQFHSLRETLRRVLCECETEKLWSAAQPTKAQIVDAATKHLQKSWSLLCGLRAENDDLVYRINELQKLAECRDCPVLSLTRTRRHIYDW
jgi:hypothetical protein